MRKTALGVLNDGGYAEDVVQDVFVSAWKSRHSFDPQKGKLATWLYRITVNQCTRYLKKNGQQGASLEYAQARGFQPSNKDKSSIRQCDLEEYVEYDRMMTAVQSLNGNHRPVIVLRYLHDLPYQEIAQVLEIPLGTVKSRINEAIKVLRREFNGEKKL